MTEEQTDTPPRKGLYEHGTALVHSSLHDFVMTHRPGDSGLYPLLNHIILTVQRPVLLVIFTKPIAQVLSNPGSGWMHSFPYPEDLRDELVVEVDKLLREKDKGSRDRWIFEVDKLECGRIKPENNLTGEMYGFGVLYLRTEFKVDPENRDAGKAWTYGHTEEPILEPLDDVDVKFVSGLLDSICSHEAATIPDYKLHFHHISHYWVHARDSAKKTVKKAVFDREHLISNSTDLVDADDVQKLLRPVFSEIDTLYREARGGTPGVFEYTDHETGEKKKFNTRTEAGASMLFSRHREAQDDGDGIRPPTIAFFFQLRTPMKNREKNSKEGYRIVPIVTRAMALDLAAALVDYRVRMGKKNKKKKDKEEIDFEIEDYLSRMNATLPRADFVSIEKMSEAIYEGMRVHKFLGKQEHHSMTFPAFSSGLLTFLQAEPCSAVDRQAFGPSAFFKDKNDAAFIKPIFVSGSAFAAVMTKSRAKLGRRDEPNFDAAYYNYMFYKSMVSRLLSRRVRRAISEAYLSEIKKVVSRTLTTKDYGVTLHHEEDDEQVIHIDKIWFSNVNKLLQKLAQVFPYAQIALTAWRHLAERSSHEMGGFKEELQTLRELSEEGEAEGTLYFYLVNNKYYGRKFVDADERFLGLHAVRETLQRAIESAQWYWGEHTELSEQTSDG